MAVPKRCEWFTLLEKGEGSHPVVLDVLQHTETIVFFFDISIEPSIRKVLTQGSGKDIWENIVKNFRQTSEERQEDKASQDPETSKANVSQLQLLGKLIQDLRDVRGESIDKVNFICVIPKADLFVNEDSGDTHFLTRFYKYLSDTNLLIPSLYTPNELSLQDYRSISGTGSKLLEGNPSRIQSQIDIATAISNQAIDCLKDIGHALGPEGEGVHPADREALQNIIEKGLIKVLKANFKSVYVLPVSPQGKQYDPSQERQLKTQRRFHVPSLKKRRHTILHCNQPSDHTCLNYFLPLLFQRTAYSDASPRGKKARLERMDGILVFYTRGYINWLGRQVLGEAMR